MRMVSFILSWKVVMAVSLACILVIPGSLQMVDDWSNGRSHGSGGSDISGRDEPRSIPQKGVDLSASRVDEPFAAPNTPTLLTPWDFQKGGEWTSQLRPEFRFSTTDPEGQRVRYNIRVSTDPNFGTTVIDATRDRKSVV